MSMVTSCPACTTTFRISPDQLKARHGKVRCGRCKDVFDAFKTLASLPDEPLSETSAKLAEQPAARPAGAIPLQSTLDIGPVIVSEAAPLTSTAQTRVAGPQQNRSLLVVVAILAIMLLLQMLYAFRTTFAQAAPGLRAVFERVCAYTGCVVALPRRTETLAIESSDLQTDPARSGVIILTAALRNRANGVVEHPALELTLTNAQDQAIARRVFLPRDYLERPGDASTGMPAHAEVNVRLELDTGDLKAAGYRLFLFYP